jgi:hypothetical protein
VTGVPGSATTADPGAPTPLGVPRECSFSLYGIDGNGAGTAQKDV